jgi:hypothetical protein
MLVALSICVFPAAAYAYTVVFYDGAGPLGVGQSSSTSGWNTRQYNEACRENNSGQMYVSYYVTGGGLASQSANQWTNCLQGVYVQLIQTGNFKAECTNGGVVSFPVNCHTTQP